MNNFLKKTWDEIPKATAVTVVGLIGVIMSAFIPLFIGRELKEKIAHDIFVFFSAVEQILGIIPRLIYLLVFLFCLIYAVYLKKRINVQNKKLKFLTKTYDYNFFNVMLVYKNPALNEELDPLDIISQSKVRFICKQCSHEILFEKELWRCCKCPDSTFAPEIISEYIKKARYELQYSLLKPIQG